MESVPILYRKDTLSINDQALNYVRGCFSIKFKDTYIKTPKKSSQVRSEPEEQVASMYIPVDLLLEHDSSDDVESDTFDLFEVHPNGEEYE